MRQLAPPSPGRSPRGALMRSGAVGVAATLADLGALLLLVDAFGLSPQSANIPALVLGLLVQFFGNKYLAFRDHSPDLMRQGAWFVLVEAGAFALNAAGYHALVTLTPLGHFGQGELGFIGARILVSSAVYFGYSYPLWKRVFRPTSLEVDA